MTLKTSVTTFQRNFHTLLATNPFSIVAIAVFNLKSSNWYTSDTTTYECSKIEAITSHNLDYSKLLMNLLTFKENSCPVLILSSPLNQIW